jgi:predicted phosphoribosyltransferase
MERFPNRLIAGQKLAQRLKEFAGRSDVVVLALPRGGVPVAYEIARALQAPLEVFIVRKLGTPGQDELAMGALASGGIRVMNEELVDELGIPPSLIEAEVARERRELRRRERAYRGGRPALDLKGKTVILVDDGIATGTSMRAAVEALEQMQPVQIIAAVPVAPPATCTEFNRGITQCVCLATPEPFHAVGLWYVDFRQTTDEEVCALLEQAAPDAAPAQTAS